MPRQHPSRRFTATLLALSLALLGASAQAADRYWTFIGGCGSADWFGKTNGTNQQGKTNCWAASPGGTSGQTLPTGADDVFIRHSDPNLDLTNTFSEPGRGTLAADAKRLTIAGTGGRFAGLDIAANTLSVDELRVGTGGRGQVLQSGGVVHARRLMLDGTSGRYELSGGSVTDGAAFASALEVGLDGQHGEFLQTGGTLQSQHLFIGEAGTFTRGAAAASAFTLQAGTSAFDYRVFVGGFSIAPIASVEGVFPVNYGAGSLNVSGGAFSAQKMFVAPLGMVRLSGGTVSINHLMLARNETEALNGSPYGLAFTGGVLEFKGGVAVMDFDQKNSLPFAFGGGFGTGTPTLRVAPGAQVWLVGLDVGDFGRGRLEVGAGALLTTGSATLGAGKLGLAAGDGQAVVAGGGTTWNNTGHLKVGVGGRGELRVLSGGTLSSASAALGDTTRPDPDFGRNAVSVDGSGSRWNNAGALVIGGGDSSTGQASDLTLSNGGTLVNGGKLTLRPGSAIYIQGGSVLSSAETVSGGLIDVGVGDANSLIGKLSLQAGSLLSVTAPLTLKGAVDVAAGARIDNSNFMRFEGAVSLRPGALITGDGTKVFAGGLSVGNPPGVFTDGSVDAQVFLAPTNTYFAEIGGTAEGSFDRYVTNGQIILGGTLKLISWGGYTPEAGASFDLFDSALGGSFAHIDTSSFALAAGLAWDFSQLSSTGVVGITAVPEPGTWALWLGGLLGLGAMTRRRRPRS